MNEIFPIIIWPDNGFGGAPKEFHKEFTKAKKA